MLMLCAVLFPILAGMGLAAWRPQGRMARQNYVLASACITSALALWAVFTLRDGPLFTLLTMGDHLSIAFRWMACPACLPLWWQCCGRWPAYTREYMSREGHENRFFTFYLASFGVTLGIAFSANALTMYLFYELLTLATLPLVMHAMDSKARYAGRVYLTYSMCGAP